MRNIILVFGVLMLFFGCIGGEQPQAPQENITPPPAPPAVPSFVIVSPDEGAVLSTGAAYGSVDILLSTSNLIIKPEGSMPNNVGEGHFAVSIDGGAPVHIFSKAYTLEGVEPGSHTLRIELVHNDHSSYSPSIAKTVNFYMEKTVTEYVPQDYTVTIRDFSYDPETITVNAGDRITWVNGGAYPRSATYTGVFDTEIIGPGVSATVTMDVPPGTYEYYALTHMAMKGTVIVERPG
ncbi:cupredoxin domain-containing protein [Candidatus Micrarchaeota archaeon]|nr:cupredoxin domain-containing protein [Candidatus Micrarchaeota archaeon]